ncbi:hypothetical protein KUTeg_004954 [Tegillarca granosa]|uniref:Signal recognition particle subunit SRP72 n=1 Tax=Tegillarca granosa TaxID=220873 RepID=A0ABQ9FL92_TEGGR|nr:hypothetical protein KUTeg_004954 [Tegillarca granosa]
MTAQQTNLPALYAELHKYGQSQEYERAIKTANKILHEFPKETAAFQCKIVCLVKSDKFNDALTVLHKSKEFSSELKFEKAYCEYRLNRTQEALATLRTVENPDYRIKELLAQVLYRLEEYSECYELYRDLIKNSEDDFDEERETNLSAVLASLQLWDEQNMDDPGLKEVSYELCYNMACYLIGKNDLVGAEKKLRKAEALCKKSFDDDPDITEDEIEEELAIIRVQLAYVLQKQGKNEESLQMYNQVLKNKPSDAGLTAVASNNIVTLNKDQNVFDSKKKMKVATADNLKHKLTSRQRKSISVNQCLLHFYTNQGEQCRQLASKLKEQYPDIDVPVLIDAAQLMKEKQTDKAIALLQDYAKDHPSKSLSIKLVMVQLYLNQGLVYPACDVLKSLGDVQYKPGIISALVTLYMNQEDNESASEVLEKSVAWYTSNQPKSKTLTLLMRSNADFQLKNGNPQKAAKMLEELRKKDPGDHRTLAKLISAYSQFDQAKAKAISKDLPSVEDIAGNVDVDSLEASFSTLGPKYMKKAQKGENTQPSPAPASSEMIIQKAKRKKKRKGKLPKNYNPDAVLDPERWIPRRERSYYRGKRKDKKKDIGKGTQGATASAMDMFDASKGASGGGSGSEASSPRPGTASTASPQPSTAASTLPAQGPRQQKPAQAQKKKKKKGGGKW